MHRLHVTIVVVLCLCARYAEAGLTAYDGFNYPISASMSGQNGGFGFSQPWANSSATVNSGSLTFGSLVTSGNSVAAHGPGETLNRTLSAALGAPGTTFYISFLLRSPGTPDPNLSYGLGLLGTVDSLFIGKASAPPGNTQYVLERFHGPGQFVSGVTAVAGVTDLLVVRADFAAGNDTFRLYVDPPTTGGEPASANAVKSDFDFGTIPTVQINGTAEYLFDELRIGTSYADVVPEPQCLSAVGFWIAMMRRRRRS